MQLRATIHVTKTKKKVKQNHTHTKLTISNIHATMNIMN